MESYGKKTRNPGYKSGDHWIICAQCGFSVYSSEARKRWDGLIVCPEDYEDRHPQETIRAVKDRIKPSGLMRSESPTTYKTVTYWNDCRAGIAISGLSRTAQDYEYNNVPTATFGSGDGGL